MGDLKFDYSFNKGLIAKEDIENIKDKVLECKRLLVNHECVGNEFTGWVDLPVNYDKTEFDRIKKNAEYIRNNCDAFIVIGIGGSVLGARSAIEFLGHTFHNLMPEEKRSIPQMFFAGYNISQIYLTHLLEAIEGKDICINIVSKSGTTLESAITFRILREYMEKKYGKSESAKRIFATTDKKKGALKKLADEEGYETFVVPDDIGGRYSVLSAVGMLPIAVSGADIDKIMEGAASMRERCLKNDYETNDSVMYATIRNIIHSKKKYIEIMANYEPCFHYINEWWKQLFSESEGKNHKGLFTASFDFTTDLHSQGQYIQDGPRVMFETVLMLENVPDEVVMKHSDNDIEGLNYLDGKTLDYINKKAMEGTRNAHLEAGVPNLLISVGGRNEKSLGEMYYFFMFACALSGLILGINPFDQPGVESYKRNMFTLLERPGYVDK